jgi:hypothetical protein
VLADDGDGRLGGELFRARPAQAPVPSHSDGTRKRATTMGGGWVKWGSLERSSHALSRNRSFVMIFDGRGVISLAEDWGVLGKRMG